MKQLGVLAGALLALSLVVSCVSGPVELTPAMVGAKDLVIVGSVDFSPKIQFEKYVKDKNGKAGFEVSNQPNITLSMSHMAQLLNVDANLDRDIFMLNVPVSDLFIGRVLKTKQAFMRGFNLDLGAAYFVGAVPSQRWASPASWLGRFKIDVPEDARAIYIGHIEIKLDDEYMPVGYTVKDDYDTAKVAFEAKFPGFDLVRADMQEVSRK